jgi:hypothetical protein
MSFFKNALAVTAAAALGGMIGFGALAQDAKTTPKTEKKTVAKAPSPCKGLDETACKGKTECRWNSESKDKATGTVKRKAYCSAKPKPKAKTDAK